MTTPTPNVHLHHELVEFDSTQGPALMLRTTLATGCQVLVPTKEDQPRAEQIATAAMVQAVTTWLRERIEKAI